MIEGRDVSPILSPHWFLHVFGLVFIPFDRHRLLFPDVLNSDMFDIYDNSDIRLDFMVEEHWMKDGQGNSFDMATMRKSI